MTTEITEAMEYWLLRNGFDPTTFDITSGYGTFPEDAAPTVNQMIPYEEYDRVVQELAKCKQDLAVLTAHNNYTTARHLRLINLMREHARGGCNVDHSIE